MKWYIPNWSGDYRLLSRNGTCVLEAEDPTPYEKEVIEKFLTRAQKENWLGEEFGLPLAYREAGHKTIFELKTTIAKAGPILVKLAKPIERTITAVKFADGKLEVIDQAKSKTVQDAINKAEVDEKKAGAKLANASAASVSRPTTCCPDCVPGSVERASEALLAFLTPQEHEQWAQTRSIVVEGGYTGHQYLLAHRHSPQAIRQRKICFDLDDRFVMHFHKNDVPPEEEILASKLVLEHREDWLRNEATCLGTGGRATDIFKNPFGDGMDGVADSVTISGIGEAIPSAIVGGIVGGVAGKNR